MRQYNIDIMYSGSKVYPVCSGTTLYFPLAKAVEQSEFGKR